MKKESVGRLIQLFGENGREFAGKIEKEQPEFAKFVDEFGMQKVWLRNQIPLREKASSPFPPKLPWGVGTRWKFI